MSDRTGMGLSTEALGKEADARPTRLPGARIPAAWSHTVPWRTIVLAAATILACLLATLGGHHSLEHRRATVAAAKREHAELTAAIARHRTRLAILADRDGVAERLGKSGFLSPLDHAAAVDAMKRLLRSHGLGDLQYRFEGEKQVTMETDIGPLPAWRDDIVLKLEARDEARLTAFLRDLDAQIPGRLHPVEISMTRQADMYKAEAVMAWTAAALDSAAIAGAAGVTFAPAEADGPTWPPLITAPRPAPAATPTSGVAGEGADAPQPPIRLDGLVYSGHGNWIAWINGRPIRPGQQPAPYRITRVAANAIFLRPPGGGATIRLSPGQSFGGQARDANCDNESGTEGKATPCA